MELYRSQLKGKMNRCNSTSLIKTKSSSTGKNIIQSENNNKKNDLMTKNLPTQANDLEPAKLKSKRAIITINPNDKELESPESDGNQEIYNYMNGEYHSPGIQLINSKTISGKDFMHLIKENASKQPNRKSSNNLEQSSTNNINLSTNTEKRNSDIFNNNNSNEVHTELMNLFSAIELNQVKDFAVFLFI